MGNIISKVTAGKEIVPSVSLGEKPCLSLRARVYYTMKPEDYLKMRCALIGMRKVDILPEEIRVYILEQGVPADNVTFLLEMIDHVSWKQLGAICERLGIDFDAESKAITEIRSHGNDDVDPTKRAIYFDKQFGKTPLDHFKNILKTFRTLPSQITFKDKIIDGFFFEIWDKIEACKPGETELRLCFISCVPRNIKRVTWLKTLSLRSLKTPTLPAELGALVNLKELCVDPCYHLSHHSLQFNFEFKKLTALTNLSLTRCHLREVPAGIVELKNLENLALTGNQLKTLPSNIGNLSKLKSLILNGNPLESFSETFTNLTSLKSLIIRGRDLYRIDKKKLFNQMPNLKVTLIPL